jgi:hypothetical protein
MLYASIMERSVQTASEQKSTIEEPSILLAYLLKIMSKLA